MSDINQITIIGNLTADPELRHLQDGTPLTEFTIASNRTYKSGETKNEKTTFISCTAWGKNAENITKFVKKGQRFGVTGRLDQSNWDDEKTGQKRSKHFITVATFQFLERKDKSPGSEAEFSSDNIPF